MALRSTRRTVLMAVAAVGVLIAAGNITILVASLWAQQTTPQLTVSPVPGVDNLEAVDARLWRGAAPSPEGYRALAANGVRTVVDLRAEQGADDDEAYVRSLGMESVRLPVRDGQVPTPDQVQEFLRVTRESDGLVFVHCGAGVGRTGAMAGAYLVSEGALNGRGALRRNLAVGTPTLEQVTFVARFDDSGGRRPPALVTAVSRVLDAPRRIFHNIGF